MCNNQTDCNCIAEILKCINILQENASPENSMDSCDRPMLGGGTSCLVCNTRPVSIYTCCGNGVPFSMPINKDETMACSNPTLDNPTDACSTVFRIEKIDGCCATFRVLAPNPDVSNCNRSPYIGTNSFFTFNLNCCCCVKCLSDCYVECV